MPDLFRLSHFADACLIFSSWPVILALMIMGVVSKQVKATYWGIVFLNLSIIINYALKITFKVPLSPSLHPGYAFPSGHMQMVGFFYGWLALNSMFRMQYWVGLICVAQAFGLIYFHYHTPLEVLAGLAVALFLLSSFYTLYQNHQTQKMKYGLITLASICLAYIVLTSSKLIPNYIYVHAALFYVLIFASVIWE